MNFAFDYAQFHPDKCRKLYPAEPSHTGIYITHTSLISINTSVHQYYEPYPSTFGATMFHPISDNLPSSLHSNSQAAALPETHLHKETSSLFQGKLLYLL